MYTDSMQNSNPQSGTYITTNTNASIQTLLKSIKVQNQEAEVYNFKFDTIKIEDAKQLRQIITTSLPSQQNVVVITCSFIGNEGQNALLKTLEEPPKGVIIVIRVPELDRLLPTIQSRASILYIKNELAAPQHAIDFLASSLKERIDSIASTKKEQQTHSYMSEIVAYAEQVLKDKQRYNESLGRIIRHQKRIQDDPYIPWVKSMEYIAMILPPNLTDEGN